MSEQVINPTDNPGQNPEAPVENPVPSAVVTEDWQKKHDEVKEKLLWMTADFENYKKRALKDKEDHLKFSQVGLLQEVLVVADNLERALAALPADDNDKGLLSLKQG
ncbi:MAG TPA: nucleotide exchange factor GrpE, partial [bacterium]|nr:nucleotide exchange factor GrpE [bacterium]